MDGRPAPRPQGGRGDRAGQNAAAAGYRPEPEGGDQCPGASGGRDAGGTLHGLPEAERPAMGAPGVVFTMATRADNQPRHCSVRPSHSTVL